MSPKQKRGSNILIQSSILAGANILCRLIGLFYRIPLMNIVGEVGMGYYSYAYEIYQVLLLISSNGIPLAVSLLVSRRMARREYKSVNRVFVGAMIFASSVGIVVTLITIFAADWLAVALFDYSEVAVSLRVLAPTVLLSSVMGVYRGFFQGKDTMMPTALSQVIEQIINAAVSLIAAYLLVIRGPEYAAAGGTAGTTAGALCSVVFLIIVYQLYRPTIHRLMKKDKSKSVPSYPDVIKTIAITMAPIVLSATIYQIIGLIDSSIYNNILGWLKYDKDVTVAMYGIYSGQFKVLTNVPLAIAASIAVALIPSITSAMTLKRTGEVLAKIESTLRLTMLITIPCAVGLMVLAEPIMSMLFGGANDLSTNLLRVGAITVTLYSYGTVTMSILQGINKMKTPVINSAIALVVHTVFLVVLLAFADMNIYAIVYGTAVFSFVVSGLNIYSLNKYIGYEQEIKKTFIIPAGASVVMGIIVFIVYKAVYFVLPVNVIAIMLSIITGVAIYGVAVILLGGMDEEELYSLPKGALLVRICKKFRLI